MVKLNEKMKSIVPSFFFFASYRANLLGSEIEKRGIETVGKENEVPMEKETVKEIVRNLELLTRRNPMMVLP